MWNTLDEIQRHTIGFADILAEDDVTSIVDAIKSSLDKKENTVPRSEQIDIYLSRLSSIDPSKAITPLEIRELWKKKVLITK